MTTRESLTGVELETLSGAVDGAEGTVLDEILLRGRILRRPRLSGRRRLAGLALKRAFRPRVLDSDTYDIKTNPQG